MMINWKLRLKNKTTLVTLITMIIAFVYLVLDTIGVIPAIPQEKIVKICMLAIDILGIIGIIVDPTTDGIADSERALSYTDPYKTEGGDSNGK